MRLRRPLLAALAAGTLAGGGGAIAIPGDAGPSGAATAARGPDPTVARPAPAGDPRRPSVAPGRPPPSEAGFIRLRPVTPVRVELRVRDPRGGPDWVVRTFVADHVAIEPGDRRARSIWRARCAQLGRLWRGRFGWVDATNTFRPVGVGLSRAPSWCGSRRPDLGGEPHYAAFRRVTDPAAGAAVPVQTVVWGVAGPRGRIALRAAGRPRPVARTPSGAFLLIGPAALAPSDVSGRIAYPGRRPVRVGGERTRDAVLGLRRDSAAGRGLAPRNLPRPPAEGDRPVIEARTPDPSGGLPWGVTGVRAEGGGWCVSAEGRVVGEELGRVDFELGTFEPASTFLNGCPSASAPSRRYPLSFTYGGGAAFAGEPGADPGAAGRIARRTLPGRFSIAGRAHPEVRSITIATPRDVRTLVPSPRAGAFLAVYDGGFPTGKIVLTARLRGGRVAREVLEPGY